MTTFSCRCILDENVASGAPDEVYSHDVHEMRAKSAEQHLEIPLTWCRKKLEAVAR
jgi:hypothetical protein